MSVIESVYYFINTYYIKIKYWKKANNTQQCRKCYRRSSSAVQARQSWSILYFVIGKFLYTYYIYIYVLLSKGFEFANLQVFAFIEKMGHQL
jgi:hypothetical protein